MSEIQLPEAFLKLGEVLEQGQFELLFTEEKLRLVYLMNDAVESFLVFENARMTGQYREDYEGELEAELSVTEEPEESYVLVVHQGETVVTIFFEDLSEEVHLYDYGEIGHFWVKGAEYLRQIEYKIAIVRDKLFYPQLGVKLCSMAGGGVQKIYMVFLREPSRRDRSGSDLFHLRDGFEIKMNFDRNVSCFIFVNALMHDDFFD